MNDCSQRAGGAVAYLADQVLPLQVNVITDEPVRKTRGKRSRGLDFGFMYGGFTFEAAGSDTPAGLALDVSAKLGVIPYSAETAAVRREMQQVVDAANGSSRLRFAVSPHQIVTLEARVDVDAPATPTAVVAAITETLIEAKPWLARLATHWHTARAKRPDGPTASSAA